MELPAYEDAVALMRECDERTPEGVAGPGSWLEHCEERGVFHYFTREFVGRLARLIVGLDAETCVEVGAGDGVLARGLGEQGVIVAPTDPQPAGPEVVALGAREAIERYKPDLVIACWPPADAHVEVTVLGAPGVTAFVYIGQMINGQVGPAQMWTVPRWRYAPCEELSDYSLSRSDYYSARQQRVVKHSYTFHLWAEE